VSALDRQPHLKRCDFAPEVVVSEAKRVDSLFDAVYFRLKSMASSESALSIPDGMAERTLELDDALRRLEGRDPRAARFVALHYFAGLSFPEIAALSGVAS
jgi:DNA-directed RNA polymerase specialized sigma24 family protein